MIALRERDTANLGDIFLTIKTFIRYYNEKDDSEFTFLTNSKQLSALDVSNLYNKRWLIAYSGGYPFSISGDIRSVPS